MTPSSDSTASRFNELSCWLAARLPGSGKPTIAPLAKSAGHSHAIYRVDRGAHRWVLRIASADVASRPGNADNLHREWQVLKALANTDIPHARAVLVGDGTAPIDPNFLLLEWVEGTPLQGPLPPSYANRAAARLLTDSIVDTLVAIGEIDWCAVGLGDFGKPTGYLARQFDKARTMLAAQRTRDTPLLDELVDALAAAQPPEHRIGLLHGDFCAPNIMASSAGPPAVRAVIDWETATIGDPMIDIGYLTARWVRPEESPLLAALALGGTRPDDHDCLPPRAYVASRYAEISGHPLEYLAFYQGLAMARLAVAVEGFVARRTRQGDADGAQFFAMIGDAAVAHGTKLMHS
ncbi:phosphotransferase family protein [Nocardia brasiliensis]|uniref:phosphotransferase family protein n=1 Tax=Nocardia brasiliensis TaxID=37326 RepID=UPI003D8A3790